MDTKKLRIVVLFVLVVLAVSTLTVAQEPSWSVPYGFDDNKDARFSGGPHAYGELDGFKTVEMSIASGIDFSDTTITENCGIPTNGTAESGSCGFEARAIAEGRVIYAGKGNFGNQVAIKLTTGEVVVYGHLFDIETGIVDIFNLGESYPVLQGTIIGRIGGTALNGVGGITPNKWPVHLHLELRDGQKCEVNCLTAFVGKPLQDIGNPLSWVGRTLSGYTIEGYYPTEGSTLIQNYDGVAINHFGGGAAEHLITVSNFAYVDYDPQTKTQKKATDKFVRIPEAFASECNSEVNCELIDMTTSVAFAGNGEFGGGGIIWSELPQPEVVIDEAYQKALGKILEAEATGATELDLSGMGLTVLPPEIGKVTGLKTLFLSENELVKLPSEIGKLVGLEELYVSHNHLAELPPQIGNLVNLQLLQLYNNDINTLPPEIGNNISLVILVLGENPLEGIPAMLIEVMPEAGALMGRDYVKSTQAVLVYYRNEEDLSPFQRAQKRIEDAISEGATSLNLASLDLDELPPEIGGLVQLQTLYLYDNNLVKLPPEIGNLSALKELDLGRNQLTNLPVDFGNLTTLKELQLNNNNFVVLPKEIVDLASLSLLNLDNNHLTELPPEVGNLTKLWSLYLSWNELTGLPPEIGNLTELQILLAIGNEITELPSEIGNLGNLSQLILTNNNLTELPPEIGNLINLGFVQFDGNQLRGLPPEIGGLINAHLVLDGNPLTELPMEISGKPWPEILAYYRGELGMSPYQVALGRIKEAGDKHASRLELFRLGLTGLPPEIGELVGLRSLIVVDDDLVRIPPEIGDLVSLTSLKLVSVQAALDLPPELGNLVNMDYLSLISSESSRLPPEIGNLTNLQILQLSGTFTNLPPEVIKQGTQAILEYLRNQQ